MNVLERDIISASEVRCLLSALTALKKGDGSVRLPLEWTGLPGTLTQAFNEVVELNQRMALELARLRQMVGTDGKLGGQANVQGVAGTWKDLSDSVNLSAAQLAAALG